MQSIECSYIYWFEIRCAFPVFCSYSLVIDQQMLDKQRAVCERMKNIKLDTSLLEWAPQLTSGAVELEESRAEIEVSFLFSDRCRERKQTRTHLLKVILFMV